MPFGILFYPIEMEWKPHPQCSVIETNSGNIGFALEIPLNHKTKRVLPLKMTKLQGYGLFIYLRSSWLNVFHAL